MNWVFSYGTLRLPQVQLANYGRLLEGHADELPGYRLELVAISNPDVVAVSGLAAHPVAVPTSEADQTVPGTRFALSDDELAATDTYESADYRRVLVTLTSGVRAWLYIAGDTAD